MMKTKKCKACGVNIIRGEKRCSSYGKKQRKHPVLIAACAFLVFCVVVAALDQNEETQKTNDTDSFQPIISEESADQNGYNSSSNNDVSDVSDEAELVLMQIAKDIAKQLAQNPSTVKFKDWYWGFAREGTTYAVQGTFECSNLAGVTEEHDLQVYCEASEDYSKIQPYSVYLDGTQIE